MMFLDYSQYLHTIGGLFLDGIQIVIQNDDIRVFRQVFQPFFSCIENTDIIWCSTGEIVLKSFGLSKSIWTLSDQTVSIDEFKAEIK